MIEDKILEFLNNENNEYTLYDDVVDCVSISTESRIHDVRTVLDDMIERNKVCSWLDGNLYENTSLEIEGSDYE